MQTTGFRSAGQLYISVTPMLPGIIQQSHAVANVIVLILL